MHDYPDDQVEHPDEGEGAPPVLDDGQRAELRRHLREHAGRRWAGPEQDRRDDCGDCGFPMNEHPYWVFTPTGGLQAQRRVGGIIADLLARS